MYRVVVFFALFAFWLFLSGKFDWFHIGMGVVSAALIGWWSGDLLLEKPNKSVGARIREAIGAIGYVLWLSWEIVLANIHVIKLSFHPRARSMIDPHLVTMKTSLKSEFARFVFANSITLTPGTVTVELEDDTLVIHAIDAKSAGDTMREMEARIAKVFDQ